MCRLLFSYVVRRRGFQLYVPMALGSKEKQRFLQMLKQFQSDQSFSKRIGIIWGYGVVQLHNVLQNQLKFCN